MSALKRVFGVGDASPEGGDGASVSRKVRKRSVGRLTTSFLTSVVWS